MNDTMKWNIEHVLNELKSIEIWMDKEGLDTEDIGNAQVLIYRYLCDKHDTPPEHPERR